MKREKHALAEMAETRVPKMRSQGNDICRLEPQPSSSQAASALLHLVLSDCLAPRNRLGFNPAAGL